MTGRSLAGRRVLVTGASGGIGSAVTRAFTARGATIVATGRDRAALERVATPLRARAIVADLTALEQVIGLAATVGPVDVLVNCAGEGWYGDLAEMEPHEVERLLTLDLVAAVLLVRAFLGSMRARGYGHVVLVGSIAGRVGVPREAVYGAAKAGVHGFAEALRFEVRGRGVLVTEVVPGAVDTGFFRRRGAGYQRSWPPPVGPEAVAAAVVRAVVKGRAEIFVPRWLELPVRFAGAAPRLYRRLAARAMP